MAQRWFVSRGEHVYGPWSNDDVRSHQRDGNILSSDVIWGIGEATWVTLAQWNPEVRSKKFVAPVEAPVALAVTPVAAAVTVAPVIRDEIEEITKTSGQPLDDEATVVRGITLAPTEEWHVAFDGRSLGPFTRPQLTVELRRLPSLDNVSLWIKGMREWAPVVEFLDILNELGADKREHARADIVAQAIIKIDGLGRTAPVTSISEGGIGVRLNSDLATGQIVHLEIQSAAFGTPVKGTAEIRYCGNGVVGLKFVNVDAANRASIARYVRQHAVGAAKAA